MKPVFSTQEAEIRALEARIRAECSGRVAATTSTANAGQASVNSPLKCRDRIPDVARCRQGPALTGRLFRELPISERTLRGLEV